MTRIAPVVLVVVLAAAGCSKLASVPLRGSEAEVVNVAGQWRGAFIHAEKRMQAIIDMRFHVGLHTAGARVRLLGASPDGRPVELKVEYLRLIDEKLVGRLAPYRDPQCDCMLKTEFDADVSDGVMVGNYTMRDGWRTHRKGIWYAKLTY